MRGKELSQEQIESVENDYGAGYTFSEIEPRRGVSKGAQSPIINARARNDADFIGAHNLARYCRQKNVTVERLSRGADLNDVCAKLNVSFEFLGEVVIPFLKGVVAKNENPVEILRDSLEYFGILQTTGKSRDKLLTDLKSSINQGDKVKREVGEAKMELASLNTKIQSSRDRLQDSIGLEKIQAQLKKVRKTHAQAGQLLETTEKIVGRGLTVELFDIASIEFEKQGTEPIEAFRQIASLHREYGGLDIACESKKKIHGKLSKEVGALENRELAYQRQIGRLEGQAQELQGSIIELNQEFQRTSSLQIQKSQELEGQIKEKEWTLSILQEKCRVMDRKEKAQRGKIDGAMMLWSLVFSEENSIPDRSMIVRNLVPNTGQMLPDIVRRTYKRALVKLSLDDALGRIKEIEGYRKQKETDCKNMIRNAWRITESLESRADFLQQVVSMPPIGSEELQRWGMKIVSSPNFFRMLLRGLKEKMIESYSKLTTNERQEYIEIINMSEELSREKEEKRVEEFIAAQMELLTTRMKREFVRSFAPNPFLQMFYPS